MGISLNFIILYAKLIGWHDCANVCNSRRTFNNFFMALYGDIPLRIAASRRIMRAVKSGSFITCTANLVGLELQVLDAVV